LPSSALSWLISSFASKHLVSSIQNYPLDIFSFG
jgi:hypothetical protein